ncbi:V-type ATPase subunit [bacterium]|nr:V-type ATPase subunit [bacterium]
MLTDTIRFSYINAKIRSLKGRLLTQHDYESLLKISGHKGLADQLRFTAYSKYLEKDVDSYDELIGIYYISLFKDYIKLIDSLSGKIKDLVYYFYRRYELENLKIIIRMVCYNRQSEKIKPLLFPLMKYQSFLIDELIDSKDLTDLIQRLKGTWYFEPLENAFYRFEKEGDIFPLEMALDLTYYKRLWEIVSLLARKDKKITMSLLGIWLDIVNILWIMRFKENYHFSPEEILNYSLGDGRFISKKIRNKLAYSIDRSDIIANLEGTPYKAVLDGTDDFEKGRVRLLQYALSLAKKNWHGFPFQIGIIFDYILFKDMEVKDLITLTEAKRTGFSPEKAKKYLVNYRYI